MVIDFDQLRERESTKDENLGMSFWIVLLFALATFTFIATEDRINWMLDAGWSCLACLLEQHNQLRMRLRASVCLLCLMWRPSRRITIISKQFPPQFLFNGQLRNPSLS